MTKPLKFYDIPANLKDDEGPSHRAWSPNTWRVRYALNIKRIAYQTTWIDFPDIEAEMQKLGVPTTTVLAGKALYTVPTIYDPNTNRAVTDSQKIIEYIEEQYPDKLSLIPPYTRGLQAAFVDTHFQSLSMGAFLLLVPSILSACSARGLEHFRRTREPLFGGTRLEDAELQGESRAVAISKFIDELGVIDRAISTNGGKAMFLTGDILSNADVNLAAVLTWVLRLGGSESDLWRGISAAHGGRWVKYMDAFEPYRSVP
ncbi:glutathione S-transferase [Vararia minispora EC-137]|uniref:Glutathione S-transferase n=1 Tax=Vararia minispora EC-137 TaxID=1314806 RepID=A0ACB8QS81_9AGAM|nr:glutathione S-transferase [Vararia minispora EC-137]